MKTILFGLGSSLKCKDVEINKENDKLTTIVPYYRGESSAEYSYISDEELNALLTK